MDRLSDYDYELPPDLIAQTPLADRAKSRLLWLHRDSGVIEHRQFRDVPDIFKAGDLLILNNTRVSAVRLNGRKPTGGEVEALLLKEVSPNVYEALVKPGRRLKLGAKAIFLDDLEAVVECDLPEGRKLLRFPSGSRERISVQGKTPLPPYIHQELFDRERYQTIYSAADGSAAAPTAGLHFTREILRSIEDRGVQIAYVTLHVGLDTFRPVQEEDVSLHKMHGETCEVPESTAKLVARCPGRIVAVGTTTVRTLETLAIGPREVAHGQRTSTLFIRPGYEFKVVDGMFTNFHLPRTTMLMMISALATREHVFAAYSEAIQQKYRFLSFGDSMLIL